jgi:hypothetical protein
VNQEELAKERIISQQRTAIINYAKKVGATDNEAENLADNKDFSYVQKIEHCLNSIDNEIEQPANVIKAFAKSTKPVGALGTEDLISEDSPKNSSEAVVKVKKDLGLKGQAAMDKALELYPSAFENRLKRFKRQAQGYTD